MSGTRVVATDLDSGESDEVTITNNFVLISDGTAHVAHQTVHANGTHVITIKGCK